MTDSTAAPALTFPLITLTDLDAQLLEYKARENDARSGPASIGAGDCLMVQDTLTGRVGYVMRQEHNRVPCPVISNMPEALCSKVWEEQPWGGYGETITPYPFHDVYDGLGVWWADQLDYAQLVRCFGWDQIPAIVAAWHASHPVEPVAAAASPSVESLVSRDEIRTIAREIIAEELRALASRLKS